MYAIRRIQAKPGVWCWAVAIRRRGKAHYKSFYDFRRGGSKKALAAAIVWHDRLLARTQTLAKREFHQLVRSSNRSGAPGVQFIRPHNLPQGSWQARLKLPTGKLMTQTFAVQKSATTARSSAPSRRAANSSHSSRTAPTCTTPPRTSSRHERPRSQLKQQRPSRAGVRHGFQILIRH
jgi:hypothetical protein